MHAWVGKLDEAVEEKLGLRLQAGIEAWTNALLGKNSEKDEDDQENMDTHASKYFFKNFPVFFYTAITIL